MLYVEIKLHLTYALILTKTIKTLLRMIKRQNFEKNLSLSTA